MKLSAIGSRGARRDFWDLHELLDRYGISLDMALDSYRAKYPVEDVGHVIRRLAYFADAEAEPLPDGLAPDHWNDIRQAFVDRVRALE